MKFAIALLAAAFLLAGCSKSPDTTEAVKAGIIRDLTSKVDVNNMDVNVSAVSFRGSSADATVQFSPKGAPGGGMSMQYTLEKKDDGWHIVRRQGDAAAHGGAMQSMPGAQPGEGGGGVLPPNHPRLDGARPETTAPPTTHPQTNQ